MKLLFFFFTCCIIHGSVTAQQTVNSNQISLQDLKEVLATTTDIQLIDVRTTGEYENGHIQGAKHIAIANNEAFTTEIQKLDPVKPVYLYCHSGVRSKRATAILEDMGFKEIFDFSGGWSSWSQQKPQE